MTTQTHATDKSNYKKTLNLPQTPFPMRANLAQNEPQTLKRWRQAKLYDRVQEARRAPGTPRFLFHDGPPYANGSIHVGHLLNKVLKDFVVRSQVLAGHSCPYVPGWDCHGLPIEHRVMTELVESGKAAKLATLEEDTRRMAVRRECQKYAEKYVKLQSEQMQRLLTTGEYDDPYLTMSPRYEKTVLEVFASMLERGIVYRALKPVHWSIENQTALAEAELEYYDKEDVSVYVDFEALDREAVAKAFGVDELDETPSFMIWTTTPWTLPANMAIAVNPRFRYALARIDGNVTVLASEALPRVTKAAKAEDVEVMGECDGAALLGLRYRHPFVSLENAEGAFTLDVSNPESVRNAVQSKAYVDGGGGLVPNPEAQKSVWTVVSAEYVSLEDGTGLVHTAPGHGNEDYQTGLKMDLPLYCPVKEDGTYDRSVPDWLRGKGIWTANGEIVERLRSSGHLFFDHRFTHSYPHDWRGKSPVIFRATEQWFVGVDAPLRGLEQSVSLRDLALDACESRVQFVPPWGKNRLRGMLESRPDWCLSRQRAWGLPIPAFQNDAGDVLMTPGSVRAVAQAFGERGSDAWFLEDPRKLLATYDAKSDPDLPDALRDVDVSSLKKMHDIFDVWFESGSSWNAVLRERGLGYPADLYLEGSDQHRGWFQLSLLPALAVTGEAPFKTVLTHGFMVDKDGRKMSKSGGNALEVEELLKNFGADVCRWWVCSLAYEGDIKVDLAFFEQAGESYRKVRNTLRFLLSNLFDFQAPSNAAHDATQLLNAHLFPPASLDAWVLHEFAALQDQVSRAYTSYEFRKAHSLLYDFCNDTLSAIYCAAMKDRLYCDKPDAPRRRRTQATMWLLCDGLCRLLAPVLPHTADEAYASLHGEGADSVHTQALLAFTPPGADSKWDAVFAAREVALKALEDAKSRGIDNALDAELVLLDPEGVLQMFADDLPDLLGVSRVRFIREGEPVQVNDLRGEPRCDRSWKRDGTVRQRSDGGTLTDRDAEAVGVA